MSQNNNNNNNNNSYRARAATRVEETEETNQAPAFQRRESVRRPLRITAFLPAPQLTTQFPEIDRSVFPYVTSFINITCLLLWSGLDRPVRQCLKSPSAGHTS